MSLQGLMQTHLTTFDVHTSTLLFLCKIVVVRHVYRPLDRSAVAAQQTTATVDIDTFHVQILAIR